MYLKTYVVKSLCVGLRLCHFPKWALELSRRRGGCSASGCFRCRFRAVLSRVLANEQERFCEILGPGLVNVWTHQDILFPQIQGKQRPSRGVYEFRADLACVIVVRFSVEDSCQFTRRTVPLAIDSDVYFGFLERFFNSAFNSGVGRVGSNAVNHFLNEVNISNTSISMSSISSCAFSSERSAYSV